MTGILLWRPYPAAQESTHVASHWLLTSSPGSASNFICWDRPAKSSPRGNTFAHHGVILTSGEKFNAFASLACPSFRLPDLVTPHTATARRPYSTSPSSGAEAAPCDVCVKPLAASST